jgi:ribosomal protein S18 acetylase RimI-like enzyme
VTAAWGVERGALWALDLPATPPLRPDPPAARFGPVGPPAAATIAAAMDVPDAEVGSRMARGSRALAAWHGEEIASYCWVSTLREHVGELGRDLTLPPGESYVWDCATVPRFRGRGLYTALLRAVAGTLAAEGQHRAWIGASSTNLASNRTFASVGFRAAASVVSVRLAGHGVIVRFRAAPGADAALVAAARRMLTGRG